jgi:hypothetical protein
MIAKAMYKYDGSDFWYETVAFYKSYADAEAHLTLYSMTAVDIRWPSPASKPVDINNLMSQKEVLEYKENDCLACGCDCDSCGTCQLDEETA